MPKYDKAAAYSIVIHASPQRIYDVARHADFHGSLATSILFSLRSFDFTFLRKRSSLGTSIDALLQNGFVLLEERPPHEIVLGLVGKFWTASGGIRMINVDKFVGFEEVGYAKAVWNFHLAPQSDGTTLLSTETRIVCTDEESRKKFARYWFLIGPFSGLIRREMLRTIKQQIEQQTTT